jgi:sulfite exporter TauE/SafE
MSGVEFGLLLGLGLLSSLHCAQMCGPIVITYSLASIQHTAQSRVSCWASLPGHVAYNAGRILTYVALGAVAGVLGQSMTWMGRLAGLSHTASLVAGVAMIVGGLAMMGWLPAVASLGQSSAVVTSWFLKPSRKLLTSPSISKRFALGLALGLLPCGLIYAALMKSLAAGSAWGGALDMLAFGLGTAASLLAIGVLSTSFRWTLSRWSSQIAGLAVIAMGALLLWRSTLPALTAIGGHAHHVHQ